MTLMLIEDTQTRCEKWDLYVNQCAHCLGHDHTWVMDSLDEIHFDGKTVEH